MNLELITKQIANLSRAIGSFVKNEFKNFNSDKIESKGTNDFVTWVDKESEKRLVIELAKILPGSGFIAEENSSYKQSKQYNWIIDPLDGTTNFIHGVPIFSISIGLTEGNKLIAGVVYEPNLHECFYAWDKGGAYMNGHPISVSKTPDLKEALIGTGFPYSDFSRVQSYLDLFLDLMKNTHGIRRPGSAATDLAYVASGRYDGFFEYGLKPWDVAAGALLVKEAGGFVSDFSGKENYLFGSEIIAGNGLLYQEFLAKAQEYFIADKN